MLPVTMDTESLSIAFWESSYNTLTLTMHLKKVSLEGRLEDWMTTTPQPRKEMEHPPLTYTAALKLEG